MTTPDTTADFAVSFQGHDERHPLAPALDAVMATIGVRSLVITWPERSLS